MKNVGFEMKEYLVEWEKYNKKSTTYDTGKFQESVEAENELEAIELIKQYIFDNTDKQEYPEIEITENGVEFEEFEYCNFTAKETKNETPQDRWQRKAGYISKSYKLKKELVDEFKDVCESRGRKQAEVLTELMNEFIKNN